MKSGKKSHFDMRFSHVNMGFFSEHGILKKSHVNMEHLFLMAVLTALTTIEGRLTTSLSSLDNLLQPLEASLATRPNRAERTNTAMRRRPRRPLSLQAFVALPAPQVRKQAQRQRSGLPPLMMQQTASMHSWGSPAPTWSKTSSEAVSPAHGPWRSRTRDPRSRLTISSTSQPS